MNNDVSLNEDNNNKNLIELDGEKYNLVKMVEEEIIDENGVKKIYIKQFFKLNLYEKNKESIKRCTQKYYENHKKEKDEYSKKLYKERYENDPEFREREKARSREKYLKKKQLKNES
jgi:hypothetical protein